MLGAPFPFRPTVAYWGATDPVHVQRDLTEIAQDFHTVLFPVSEEVVASDRAGIGLRVEMARTLGLEVWISPWGVAGLFGGEPSSTVADVCPTSCAVRDVLYHWLDAVLRTEPDYLFWDEPHARGRCCTPYAILGLLQRLIDACPSSIEHALYWNPDRCPDVPSTLFPSCQTVSLDLYDPLTIAHQLHRLTTLTSQVPVEPSVWVRAFGLGAGHEGEILTAIQQARLAGIGRIAIWGAFGSRGLSSTACADPDRAWQVTRDAVRRFQA